MIDVVGMPCGDHSVELAPVSVGMGIFWWEREGGCCGGHAEGTEDPVGG